MRTTHEQRFGEDWTVEQELMALLIEVTSVAAAGRQLRKPIDIPRPTKRRRGRVHPDHAHVGGSAPGHDRSYGHAVAVLAGSARAVSR